MTKPGHRLYIHSLDGIRAMAVMLVFFGHAGFWDVVPGGFGVTVFFFLSGYLITTLLRLEFENTGNISFHDFYIRRVYRIFPSFYLALLTGLILAWTLDSEIGFSLVTVLLQAVHLTNYYQVLVGYNVIPDTSLFWSLAVEEHYYLFFPLVLLWVLKRQSLSKTALIFLITCLAVLAWRYFLVLHVGVPAYHTNLATDTRIDSVLYGCILGVWMNPVLDRRPNVDDYVLVLMLCLSVAILIGTFLYRDPVFRETLRYSLQGIALLPLFYLAILRRNWCIFSLLNCKWVRMLGRVSYEFYLFHMMAMHLVAHELERMGIDSYLLFISVGFLLTLGVSILINHLIGIPFARKRRKLYHAT